jgi:DNA-binding NarL/FixJ family response regulator
MPSEAILHRSALVAIAVATLVVNGVLGVDWRLAAAAAGAVLLFGAITLRLGRTRKLVALTTHAFPLTRKELEVAILVAQGKSNKAIAAQLFNSERTIENHVQHIYNKLNIDSRPQLALWMSRRGLLPEPINR